jgi:hypothetical protein
MQQAAVPLHPANSFRAWLGRVWEDPESRSTLVGIVGVVIFYLLLWAASPWLFRPQPVVFHHTPNPAAKQFNIEIAPEMFAKPEAPKPQPFKFVETNPDAPENVPDKTQNFAARNTQAAQEKPAEKNDSDRPTTEGQKDVDTTQIVSGQLTKPVEHQEAVPEIEHPPQEQKVATLKAEQNPLPGFEKKEGEEKTAYGSNVAKFPENARPIPEKIDGAKNAPLIQGATEMQPAIDPLKPRQRPMLVSQPRVRPAILADNPVGVKGVGPIAYDAKWSNYGAYLQRLIDTVQIQWERILGESRIYPPSGTTVIVKFIIDSDGRIARIVNVDNQSNDQGGRACVSAITDRSPYGAWTDDMKAMLGAQQEMTFSFHYQ